jgi:hypothetical protein
MIKLQISRNHFIKSEIIYHNQIKSILSIQI